SRGIACADQILCCRANSCRRYGDPVLNRIADAVFLFLEIAEEEKLVSFYRAAEAAAPLLQIERGFRTPRRLKEVVRIPRAVAPISVGSSMQGIAPRFNPDVHHRARLPAVNRTGILLRFELVDGVGGRCVPGVA